MMRFSLHTTWVLALFMCLVGVTASAQASGNAPMAYYNQYSTPSLDIAMVDKMLSQRTAVDAFRTFVPVYPTPQQHYLHVPVQPQAPQQQYQVIAPANDYYGPSYGTW